MRKIILVLFGFFSCLIMAQELPPISVFQSQDYNAEAQNWAISQDDNKHIYVANNSGLIEYNGAQWNLYNSPNEIGIGAPPIADTILLAVILFITLIFCPVRSSGELMGFSLV